MVTWDNYEEYMMMHADGELQHAEAEALMAFVAMHPELKAELAGFNSLRIVPDTKQVYTLKQTLIKPVSAKRAFVLPAWQRYAIAAGVAALLCLTVYQQHDNTNNLPDSNNVVRLKKANRPTIAPNTPAASQPAVAGLTANNKTEAVAAQRPVPSAQHLQVAKKTEQKPDAVTQVVEQVYVQRLAAAVPAVLPHPIATAAPRETELPDYEMAIADAPSKSLLDRLPIEDTKIQGMENVALALEQTIDRVNAVKQKMAAATLTIHVEKRKLILSF